MLSEKKKHDHCFNDIFLYMRINIYKTLYTYARAEEVRVQLRTVYSRYYCSYICLSVHT